MNILKIQTEMLKEEVKGNLRMLWHRDDDGYLWIVWDGIFLFRVSEEEFYLRLSPRRNDSKVARMVFDYAEKTTNRLQISDDIRIVPPTYTGKAQKLLGDDGSFVYVSCGYLKMVTKNETGKITFWNKPDDSASSVVVKRDGELIAAIAPVRIKEAKQ